MKKLVALLFIFTSAVMFAQEGVTLSGNTLKIQQTPPTWPGCDGSISQKQNCFNQKVVNHVIKGFKFPAGHKMGQKIIADFTITKDGKAKVNSITGGTPELQAEVKRKIMSIPQMIPSNAGGTKKDFKVKIPFTF